MTKRTKSKAPGFLPVRLVLYAVGAASAAVGVAGWIVPELSPATLSDLPWAAIVLAGMTALSAFVVPVCCEIIGRSGWGLLTIPAALVFGAINAYSFHHAVDALIEEPRRTSHYAEHVSALADTYRTAQAAVAGHAFPEFPENMITPRIEARTQAWELAHAALEKAEARAKADLDAAPVYQPFIAPVTMWGVTVDPVWVIAILIDFTLALALAGVSLTIGAIKKKKAATRAKPRTAKKRKARKPIRGSKPYLAFSKP